MITPEHPRWTEFEPLLDQVLDLPRPKREQFIASLTVDDELLGALRQAVMLEEITNPLFDGFDPASLIVSPQTAVDTWVGRELGGWRITDVLGQGGMAVVFVAERVDGPKQVAALKLLQRGLFDQEERRQFIREQEILARLNHPGVARLIDAGFSDDGIPWLVMEKVDGLPIDFYCDQNKLDLRERMALVVSVCDVIAHAQQLLVVHRDLKPEHIRVNSDGTIKVLDFGIAKMLEEPSMTRTMLRRGTPRYAAPEQVDGGTVTTATDVFALGRLTLELAEAAEQSVPKELWAVLSHAQQTESTGRYPNVLAFQRDLQRFLDNKPVRARSHTPLRNIYLFVRRNAVPFLAVVSVLVALGAGVWVAKMQALRAQEAAELANSEAVRSKFLEQRAEDERARAEAVKDFIIDLFEADLPGTDANQMPSTRQLVDLGIERAQSRHAGPDDIRAVLLATLAKIVAARNQRDEARRLIDASMTLMEPWKKDDPEAYGEVLTTQVDLWMKDGAFESALPALEAHIGRLKQSGSHAAVYYDLLRQRAWVAFRQGEFADGRQWLERAQSELHEEEAPLGLQRLNLSSDMVFVYSHSKRFEESVTALNDVLARQKALDRPMGELVNTEYRLASNLTVLGRYPEAKKHFDAVAKILAAMPVAHTPEHARVQRALADYFSGLGLRDEAMAALMKSAEHWRHIRHLPSIEADDYIYYERGMYLASLNDHDLALQDLTEGMKRIDHEGGYSKIRHGLMQMEHARLLCRSSSKQAAAAMESLTQLESSWPTSGEGHHRDTVSSEMVITMKEAKAQCLFTQNKVAEALSLVDQAYIDSQWSIPGLVVRNARRTLFYAELLTANGQNAAAQEQAARVLAEFRRVRFNPEHPFYRQAEALQTTPN